MSAGPEADTRAAVAACDFLLLRRLPEALRPAAAELYWSAFAGKLGRILGPRRKAAAYLEAALVPAHALAAVSVEGRLLGLAGLQTPDGGMSGGTRAALEGVYGRAGGVWRHAALMALAADPAPGRLHIDGLCVAEDMRGRGIGGLLLNAACAEAGRRGLGIVRLEVEDRNRRARALYQRAGFVATSRRRLGALRLLCDIRGVQVMERRVDPVVPEGSVEQAGDPGQQHEGPGRPGLGKGGDLGVARP